MNFLLPLLAALATGTAAAHQVWLEVAAGRATLHFGEYRDNRREASPGLLDKLGRPVARHHAAAGATPVPGRKTGGGDSFDVTLAPGESLTPTRPH